MASVLEYQWLVWMPQTGAATFDPSTEMIVKWRDSGQAEAVQVDYGLASGTLTSNVNSTSEALAAGWIHTAKLTGLTADTTFYFKVSSDAGAVRKFRTAPAAGYAGEKVFAQGSDAQINLNATYRANFRLTSTVAMSKEPLALISSGDFVDNGNTLSHWTEIFDIISGDGSGGEWVTPTGFRVPLMAILGNHELEGTAPEYVDAFFTPQYHWKVQIGDVLIIGLDSGNIEQWDQGSYTNPTTWDGQLGFLTDSLIRASTDETIRWIIATYHYPAWPGSTSSGGTQAVKAQTIWGPLFQQYGVSSAYAGHDHFAKLSQPIDDWATATGAGNVTTDALGLRELGDGPMGNTTFSGSAIGSWYIDDDSYDVTGGGRQNCDILTIDGLSYHDQCLDADGSTQIFSADIPSKLVALATDAATNTTSTSFTANSTVSIHAAGQVRFRYRDTSPGAWEYTTYQVKTAGDDQDITAAISGLTEDAYEFEVELLQGGGTLQSLTSQTATLSEYSREISGSSWEDGSGDLVYVKDGIVGCGYYQDFSEVTGESLANLKWSDNTAIWALAGDGGSMALRDSSFADNPGSNDYLWVQAPTGVDYAQALAVFNLPPGESSISDYTVTFVDSAGEAQGNDAFRMRNAIYRYEDTTHYEYAGSDWTTTADYESTVTGTESANLLGFWRLGEGAGASQVLDETANNNDSVALANMTFGTAGGISGDADTAATFNGSSSYVQIENAASAPRTEPTAMGARYYTVTCWFKRSGNGTSTGTGGGGIASFEPLVVKGCAESESPAGVNANYMLGINTVGDNKLSGDTEEMVGGLNKPVTGSTTIVDGTWYFAAIVFNGSTHKVYLNAVEDGSISATNDIDYYSGQPLAFGTCIRTNGTTRQGYFNGVIDEVAIWDKALTLTQLQTLHSIGSSGASKTGVWRICDGTRAGVAVTGAPTVSPGTLPDFKAIVDGDTPANVELYSDATQYTATVDATDVGTTATTIAVGATYDLSKTTQHEVEVGAIWVEGGFDTGIYTSSWEDAGEEVEWDTIEATASMVDGQSIDVVVHSSDDGVTSKDSILASLDDGANSLDISTLADGRYNQIIATFDRTGGVGGAADYETTLKAIESANLKGYWRLGESLGASQAIDETANNNDSVAVVGTTFGTAGAIPGDVDTAATFNGSTNYIQLENAEAALPRTGPTAMGCQQYTVTCWFNRTGTGDGDTTGNGGIASFEPIVAKGCAESESPAGINANYMLGINTVSGVKLAGDTEKLSDGVNVPVTGSTTIVDGTWYFAAIVYNGSTHKVYLNAVEDGSVAMTEDPDWYSGQPLVFGTSMQTNGTTRRGYFNGVIDEVAVWNTPLSVAQLESLYEIGEPAITSKTPTLSSIELIGTLTGNQPSGGTTTTIISETGLVVSNNTASGDTRVVAWGCTDGGGNGDGVEFFPRQLGTMPLGNI